MKSSRFHLKSSRFHLKSGGFHVKSSQNLIKSDVSTKTLQFGGCREGAMTQDCMKSWFIAPLLHSSNWIVLVETFAFIRFWVDFAWNPADFMKSKDHLQGIVTLCLKAVDAAISGNQCWFVRFTQNIVDVRNFLKPMHIFGCFFTSHWEAYLAILQIKQLKQTR